MSNWTRYTLTYDDTCSDVVVDVREPASAETVALCTEINGFWSGADERIKEADGDVVLAVLEMLCRRALYEDLTSLNALHDFTVRGVEGWPLLDGSEGIKLVSTERIEFDGDVSVETEPVGDVA
ncbi:DUF2528 family protein [Duganella sp. FT92W]|uniref:DUF2528 family protein n=1 Tax=Pseudoduganella rivuli TaxID=2666085 RepID=A0A7X2LU51_9BURK|nr:DUF2528 family protein [Pseudoduganella rivuli]MRV72524.1 DUF2528 family protein [Pseudoduganella rivuli]